MFVKKVIAESAGCCLIYLFYIICHVISPVTTVQVDRVEPREADIAPVADTVPGGCHSPLPNPPPGANIATGRHIPLGAHIAPPSPSSRSRHSHRGRHRPVGADIAPSLIPPPGADIAPGGFAKPNFTLIGQQKSRNRDSGGLM